MIRKLLATTAIVALTSTGAWAQETQPATTVAPAADSATTTGTMATGTMATGEHLASNFIGENVYTGTGDNAEKIGDVNDLVVAQDGKIQSVVIGVGGFLGIGEKNVAVNFSDLSWSDRNGDRYLVAANTSKESLQALPAFDRSTYDAAPAATTAMNQNADGSMNATNGTMAPAPAEPGTSTGAATDNNAAMNNNMAATPDQTQTAAIDRSTLTEVPADKLTAETLVGTTVYGANDANVGEIADIVLDTSGKVDAVLIDVGGFLGIGEKRVAVGMDKLSFMQDANGNRYLYTTFTKEQLDAQTAYNADTYATDRNAQRMTVQ